MAPWPKKVLEGFFYGECSKCAGSSYSRQMTSAVADVRKENIGSSWNEGKELTKCGVLSQIELHGAGI